MMSGKELFSSHEMKSVIHKVRDTNLAGVCLEVLYQQSNVKGPRADVLTKISSELEVTMLFCNSLMSLSQYLERDVSIDINLRL